MTDPPPTEGLQETILALGITDSSAVVLEVLDLLLHMAKTRQTGRGIFVTSSSTSHPSRGVTPHGEMVDVLWLGGQARRRSARGAVVEHAGDDARLSRTRRSLGRACSSRAATERQLEPRQRIVDGIELAQSICNCARLPSGRPTRACSSPKRWREADSRLPTTPVQHAAAPNAGAGMTTHTCLVSSVRRSHPCGTSVARAHSHDHIAIHEETADCCAQ
jgi:hypothetical protein